MRFRPANIRVINRRDRHLGRHLRCPLRGTREWWRKTIARSWQVIPYQGFTPAAENNLRTKPPENRAVWWCKTQEKAFRINTATYLEKSAAWRFESSPVHQSFQVLKPSLLKLGICYCSGNCSGWASFLLILSVAVSPRPASCLTHQSEPILVRKGRSARPDMGNGTPGCRGNSLVFFLHAVLEVSGDVSGGALWNQNCWS